jgi:acetylornithine deacetylase
MPVESLTLDDERFVDLLGKLIGEARHLQNNPPDFVPRCSCRRQATHKQPSQTLGDPWDPLSPTGHPTRRREDRAGQHILSVLEPLSEAHGGPLRIKHISFVEGRGNIIVEVLFNNLQHGGNWRLFRVAEAQGVRL